VRSGISPAGTGNPRIARACSANSDNVCVAIVTMPVSCGRGETSLKSTSSPRTNSSTPKIPVPPSAPVIVAASSSAPSRAESLIGCGCQLSR